MPPPRLAVFPEIVQLVNDTMPPERMPPPEPLLTMLLAMVLFVSVTAPLTTRPLPAFPEMVQLVAVSELARFWTPPPVLPLTAQLVSVVVASVLTPAPPLLAWLPLMVQFV